MKLFQHDLLPPLPVSANCQISPTELMSKYSHVSNWSKSPIQAFAWHPHIVKFAIALHDDSVQVHNVGSSICPILKHKLQKQVADIAWQPLSASVLAVACQSCVLIWHVDPTSLAVRPSTSTVQILRHANHSPVTSLAWSPDSSHLISASPNDPSLMVWDVPSETGISLKRDWSGGFTLLSYSPDGSKLCTGTPSTFFSTSTSQGITSRLQKIVVRILPKHENKPSNRNMKTHKTTLMLFITNIMLVVCFLPYLTLHGLGLANDPSVDSKDGLFPSAFLMRSFFVNSVTNCFIYGFCCPKFRKESKIIVMKLFCCTCCPNPTTRVPQAQSESKSTDLSVA